VGWPRLFRSPPNADTEGAYLVHIPNITKPDGSQPRRELWVRYEELALKRTPAGWRSDRITDMVPHAERLEQIEVVP